MLVFTPEFSGRHMQVTLHSPTYDFAAAGSAVIRFLHERLGFDLWMVTRTEGDDWIVLQAEDHGYAIAPNTVFRWSDSFCSHMVAGRGPRVAPRSSEVSAYATAPIGRQIRIESYIGVPITCEDGSLFGTLCAVHPAPQPEAITKELPLVELLAAMLSGILRAELRAIESQRHLERARSEAETDALTHLYNRRGWDRLMELEESRCRRYGYPACVVVVDLDGLKSTNDISGHDAGDELLRSAAASIRKTARTSDIVARLGGDEFGILGLECDDVGAAALLQHIRTELEQTGVAASAGIAMRFPAMGLEYARREADQAMYRDKAGRKSTGSPVVRRLQANR